MNTAKKTISGNRPAIAGRKPRHAGWPRHRVCVTVLATAIAVCFNANAQSITGGLHGSAPVASGISVVVTNPSTGYSKTIGTNKDGRYNLDLLAPGDYEVRVEQGGKILGDYTVKVSPNASTTVPAVRAATATQTLATINVTAHDFYTVVNPIDVTTSTLSSNYSSQLLSQLPVSQTSIYAIPLLESYARATSVQGLGLPQVMGAGPTENRYYYNGFDTSYDVTGVGAITFPRDAVTNTEFIPSNSPLEYTSTTGSVTSATLRQGSNTFHGGYSLYFTFPTSRLLNPRGKDSFYNNLSGVSTHYLYNSDDSNGAAATNYFWASGPIIKDKLFFAATAGYESPAVSTNYSGSQKTVNSSREKSGFINLTWDISKNQALDVAYYRVRDNTSTNIYQLAQNYVPSSASSVPSWSGVIGRSKLAVANYHWHINDKMTLQLMAGYMKFSDIGSDENIGEPYVLYYDYATGVNSQLNGGASGYEPYNYYFAKRGFRGIFTWDIGDHEITIGGEKYTNIYHYEPATVPAGYYQYYDASAYAYYYGGQPISGTNGGLIPANGEYLYQFYYSSGGTFDSTTHGYYAFDNWQVTPNLIFMFGARLDQMRNNAANGETFLHMNTVSPRLGLAWDVHGDSTLKIGANAGKYTLPMPSGLNYSAASAETYYYSYYSYSGINADGTPQNPQQLGDTITYANGSVPRLSTIASQGIKNTYQYEYQVYAQQQLTPAWSLLGSADVHVLKNLVDQTCDQNGAIADYVRSNGHPDYVGLTTASGCIEFNPGRSIVLRDDLDGNGTLSDITIPNSYLGMPAASRKYYGLTFTLAHARTPTQPYVLSLSYTWGHLYGNSDGYVNLTKSTNPADGATGNYNFREITAGNYGNLAGDIRSQFVAYGTYFFPHGFRLGSVFQAHTGAPSSYLGTYPDQNASVLNGLGAVTHYCNGQLVSEGSTWRAPFFWQLDLDFGYDFDFGRAGKLSLDLRMTNVTNRRSVLARDMVVDTGTFDQTTGLPSPSASYFAISSYQAPRTTFLYLRYSF